jgi:hypothetical protein
MKQNPKSYLFSTQRLCCEAYFSWTLKSCLTEKQGSVPLNSSPSSTSSSATPKFIPNWDVKPYKVGSSSSECIETDGTEPEYFYTLGWTADSLEDCCSAFFQWDHTACIQNGRGEDELLVPSSPKYIPNWFQTVGVSQCIEADGTEPEYFHTLGFIKDSVEECCTEFFGYDFNECMLDEMKEDQGSELLMGTKKYWIEWNSYQ